MATAQNPENVPDLVNDGVALEALEDGGMLLGQADGDKVLLARQGSEVFAVGAKCTHYDGPLHKGLMVGHTVRCPWHHACFDLRTGEALRAPALKPIARWHVEQKDGRWFVAGKQKLSALESTPSSREALEESHPANIVVVGTGAAGGAAVEMLRRSGYEGSLTMIDPEPAAPYDRPNLSKDYLAGSAPESWIPLRSDDFYQEHDVDVIKQRVEGIDVGAKQVRLADGSTHPYDALLLATGAAPRKLDMPGHDLPHVHVLRSFDDSRAIIAQAEKAKTAVVIGGSFIGLEVAASLRERGLEVHVVAPEEKPLARVLGDELGAMIQSLHEEQGVVFHLNHTVALISTDEVELDDGAKLPADLVVVGVGVTPRLELAEQAGLELDRGVVVDRYLETSAKGVYAAGDIARWPDPHSGQAIRVEHWVVAQRLGQAAARNMLGASEAFEGVPFFWSKHYDLTVRYSGHAEDWDSIDIDGDVKARDFSAAYRKGGKTLAVASVKRDLENLKAAEAMERNDEAALERIIAS